MLVNIGVTAVLCRDGSRTGLLSTDLEGGCLLKSIHKKEEREKSGATLSMRVGINHELSAVSLGIAMLRRVRLELDQTIDGQPPCKEFSVNEVQRKSGTSAV